jgi:hypothetical protein
MAVLISKVVRSSSAERVDDEYSSGHRTTNRTNVNRHTNRWPDMPQPDNLFPSSMRMDTNISVGRVDGIRDEKKGKGIVKTVTTVVKSDSDGESCEGYQVTGDFTSHKSSSVDALSPS